MPTKRRKKPGNIKQGRVGKRGGEAARNVNEKLRRLRKFPKRK